MYHINLKWELCYAHLCIYLRSVALRNDLYRNVICLYIQVESYPPSCIDKIPNFVGNKQAADRATRLREFKDAKVDT